MKITKRGVLYVCSYLSLFSMIFSLLIKDYDRATFSLLVAWVMKQEADDI